MDGETEEGACNDLPKVGMRLRKMQSRHYVKTIALEFCLLKIKKYKTEPKEKKTLNLEKQALVKRIGFFLKLRTKFHKLIICVPPRFLLMTAT